MTLRDDSDRQRCAAENASIISGFRASRDDTTAQIRSSRKLIQRSLRLLSERFHDIR